MKNNYRSIVDIYNAFISPDGVYIKLPVPIDSFLYEVVMKCETKLGKDCKNCNRQIDKECAYKFDYIQRVKLDIDNIGKILRRYGIDIFDSKEKAVEAGKRLQAERIQRMREKGYNIDDNGKLTK